MTLNAVVSDIHGNLEALEAVIADLERRKVRQVACLGDFVGYGASPNECIDLLRPRIDVAVAGNHDLAACGRIQLGYFHQDAAIAARWTDAQLTPENRRYLEELPFTSDWRSLMLVHSSPADPKAWHYVLSPADAEYEMSTYAAAVCLIGHSHYPGAFTRGNGPTSYTRGAEIAIEPERRYLVNVASVGQPRDGDPRAGYLLVDEEAHLLTHVRLEYDIDGAVRRIREAGLPEFLGDRLRWGE